MQLFEPGQNDALVSSDKTDIIGVTVTILLHRLPFPIHQNGPDGMGCSVNQCFQYALKGHISSKIHDLTLINRIRALTKSCSDDNVLKRTSIYSKNCREPGQMPLNAPTRDCVRFSAIGPTPLSMPPALPW